MCGGKRMREIGKQFDRERPYLLECLLACVYIYGGLSTCMLILFCSMIASRMGERGIVYTLLGCIEAHLLFLVRQPCNVYSALTNFTPFIVHVTERQ